ncbi:unnamed protein product [Vicia faba]|uniref:AMP-dependent synthetase/ligase domain-containing protein n=1 Tax=Vicia faba TaxID=3906 RepID=A0AAV0ZCB9_VICFA|nr:unnamed protein product [Vicia faba]
MASGLHKMGVSQGVVVTPLNPVSSVAEIRKQVNECGVSFAFTIPENFKKLKSFNIPNIIVPENEKDLKYDCFSCFFNLIYSNFDFPQRPVIKQEDTAGILYSSGTTGVSKGVVLTHRNLIAMVELFARFQASSSSSSKNVFLAALPMFHIFGLSLTTTGLLSLGSTVVVMKKFQIDEAIRVIDEYNVTHFDVVPPMLVTLTEKAKRVNGSKLLSLRRVLCGTAPLTTTIINEFVQVFPNVDLIQAYGMTESATVGSCCFDSDKFHNYSSVGLLAPNMEAKVVDVNNGALLPPGRSGGLWLRGPSITKGYLNNEEATMTSIDKDGCLNTGDIVYFDENGYLYLCDRLKDMIKYKGFQIAPADLEVVLILHPEIVDVAVTGVLSATNEEAFEVLLTMQGKQHIESSSKVNNIKHRDETPPDVRVRKLKDQLIQAKVYLSLQAVRNIPHLTRELRLRVKEVSRTIGEASKDSDLPRNANERMKEIEQSLMKARQIQDDCSTSVKKLRAMLHSSEDQLRVHKKHTLFLTQLTAKTLPKGLHCLPLRLTTEYYNLNSSQQQFPNQEKLEDPGLYHYAIFSDNILATAVVVNSTDAHAKDSSKHVFHIVTDRLNYAAMRMWFLANPPGKAAVQVQNIEDFAWLNSSYSPVFKQLSSPSMIDYYFKAHRASSDSNLKFRNPKYLSMLNHLRFYLPEIFPNLKKVLFLDDDVIVQKDLTGLWSINLKGNNFDPRACGWAYGMNVFDLVEWKKQNITEVYHNWQKLLNRVPECPSMLIDDYVDLHKSKEMDATKSNNGEKPGSSVNRKGYKTANAFIYINSCSMSWKGNHIYQYY